MFAYRKRKPENHNRNNQGSKFRRYRSLKELHQMKLESDSKKQAASQNNSLEQEADKNADIVTGKKNEPTSISKIGGGAAMMKKSDGASSQSSTPVNNSISGGGQQLPDSTKSKMEAGFQSDFSGVKIHNDENAHKMSASLNAKAFTTGSDIYFGKGHYDPNSQKGEHLIAHELTHTLQQGASQNVIQRAEVDTNSEGSKNLKDSKDEINKYVNSVIDDSKKFTSKLDRLQYVANTLASGSGWSAIETWAKEQLPSDMQYDPDISETKYAGAKEAVSVLGQGKLWLLESSKFDIINPSILVNGIKIGSDKLGHFFQQGLDYFNKVQGGMSMADVKKYGESSEMDYYGLNQTGVYSRADLAANMSGYGFWTDLYNNPNMNFDIANYINKSWNEEFNTNRYANEIGSVVWHNLIDGATRGYISYPEFDSHPLTETKATTTLNGTSFHSKFTYTVPDVNGTHTLEMRGKLKYLKDTSIDAIKGVQIDFDWTHSNGKSGTGILRNYKEVLLKGKLMHSNKSDYRTIKLYL